MTVATPRASRAANVVAEIAARRRDGPRSRARRRSRPMPTSPPRPPARPIVERLAAPGPAPHRRDQALLAIGRADRRIGLKTSSRARGRTRPAARRRSRSCASRTGSAAPSTTCGAVRAAVAIPVLAKEFVVDARQLAHVARGRRRPRAAARRPAPAARRSAASSSGRSSLGLEPLVEAHDERELRSALETDARLIGLNNRDLRHARRGHEPRRPVAGAGARRPPRRSPSLACAMSRPSPAGARSGSMRRSSARRSCARPTRSRRLRSFVAAGRQPQDPANVARRPFVKICGVTDRAGALAAVRAGADAIGLNLAPGTPRALEIDEAAALARIIREAAPLDPRPRDRRRRGRAVRRAHWPSCSTPIDPDAIQFNGREPVAVVAGAGRESWKAIHLPAAAPDRPRPQSSAAIEAGRAFLAAGASRILLDTAGGPHPGGTGVRADSTIVAAIAREMPVTLAGGLHAGKRRRGPARDPGRRRGRRERRRGASRARGAAAQGPVPGRALRQAGQGGPRRPTQHAVRPDARPRRPARCGCRRAVGDGA